MERSRNYWLLAMVVIVALSGGLFYCACFMLQSMQVFHERLDELQQHKQAQTSPSQEDVAEPSELGSCEWTSVRSKVRNCVVQVFSHIGDFNWLEPYRAPGQGQG